MKYRHAFFLPTLLCAPVCHAAQTTTTGTIGLLRDETLLQPDGRIQEVMIFKLSVPYSNGCIWAWLSSTDKGADATALAAKISGASVTITYDNTIVSPWGDTGICGAVAIDLN